MIARSEDGGPSLLTVAMVALACIMLLTGCRQEREWVADKLGLSTTLKAHIDVGVDVSAADHLEEHLALDSAFVAELLKRLSPRMLVHIYSIHAAAQWQEPILRLRTPERRGTAGAIIDSARQDALAELSRVWPGMLTEARKQGYQYESDIVGMLRVLAEHIRDQEAKRRAIIILSDMQDVRKERWNFEKRAPSRSLLEDWKRDGLVPDLSGVEVFVFRFWPAHGIDPAHYERIRRFWLGFFKLAGADVRAFRPQREIDLVLKPPRRPYRAQ